MIIVTGGAGFIGSNIVKALNRRGVNDLVVVDNLEKAEKFRNIADCEIADYVDKHKFIEQITAGRFAGKIAAVFHEGACSDTMEYDGAYMMQNNYEYSKSLLHFCQQQKIPFLYASSAAVYGGGRVFRETRECEAPLNVYGYSKFLFDQYVRGILPRKTGQIAGFRYFNVYGEREQHKGRMASVAFHLFNQYRADGRVRLFKGSGGYTDGEQRRDFISVEDVVAVNLFFFDHPDKSGIFNVGTGRSQTFNEVAAAVVNCLCDVKKESPLDLNQMQQQGVLHYVEFPPGLAQKYQSFTEADISALRSAGYKKEFLTVEQGVRRYVDSLLRQ